MHVIRPFEEQRINIFIAIKFVWAFLHLVGDKNHLKMLLRVIYHCFTANIRLRKTTI